MICDRRLRGEKGEEGFLFSEVSSSSRCLLFIDVYSWCLLSCGHSMETHAVEKWEGNTSVQLWSCEAAWPWNCERVQIDKEIKMSTLKLGFKTWKRNYSKSTWSRSINMIDYTVNQLRKPVVASPLKNTTTPRSNMCKLLCGLLFLSL